MLLPRVQERKPGNLFNYKYLNTNDKLKFKMRSNSSLHALQ